MLMVMPGLKNSSCMEIAQLPTGVESLCELANHLGLLIHSSRKTHRRKFEAITRLELVQCMMIIKSMIS